jgi:hypothetical protein
MPKIASKKKNFRHLEHFGLIIHEKPAKKEEAEKAPIQFIVIARH